jgi:tetratricopeptide (TPR) repeat protein
MGKCKLQSSEFEIAVKHLEESLHATATPLEKNTLDIEINYMLGISYEGLENYEMALNHLERVEKKDPEFRDVREKIKKYSHLRIDDSVKELNTAPDDVFKKQCETVITSMGFHLLETIMLKNGNCNLLAKEIKGKRALNAIAVIRGKDYIDEDDVFTLKRTMLTTGEVSMKAEEIIKDNSVSFYNHQAFAKELLKAAK